MSAAASPDGSVARRQSTRPDLLAFEIRSKISKPDIEWMSEPVDEAFDVHDDVDMLLITTNYEGSDVSSRISGEARAGTTASSQTRPKRSLAPIRKPDT